MLDVCAAAAGAEVSVHSCAAALPWKVLQRSNIAAVSVDVATLEAADLDSLAEFVESGRAVILGVVSSSTPARRPSAEEVAAAVVAVTDRLGFGRSALRDRVGVTPACGWPRRRRSGPAPRSGWPGGPRRLSPTIPTPSAKSATQRLRIRSAACCTDKQPGGCI